MLNRKLVRDLWHLRGQLAASPHFRKEWVLEFVDSRYPEVRAEGWAWVEREGSTAPITSRP